MVANTSPIFARQPQVDISDAILGPTAVTATDGSGALELVFQADVDEGSFVREVKLKASGTVAATVVRLFLCTSTVVPFVSGTTNTVSNTVLIAEISLAAVTASNTSAQNDLSIPVMQAIPPGMKLLMSFGASTGAAGNGYSASAWGGRY